MIADLNNDYVTILGAYPHPETLPYDMRRVLDGVMDFVESTYYLEGEEGEFVSDLGVMPDTRIRLNLSLEVIEDDS